MLQFLARLHPLIVHLPLGILFVAALLTYMARHEKGANLRPAMSFAWSLGVLAAIFAGISGWFLAKNEGGDPTILGKHQTLGIATAVLATLLWYLQKNYPLTHSRAVVYAGSMTMFMVATSFLGGNLTHGEGFLWKKMPVAETTAEKQAESGLTPADDVPLESTAPADAADVEALHKIGAVVMPIANGSPYLSINAVNAPEFSNQDAKILAKMANQLVWLKLGGTAISDSALLYIGQLPNLSRLQLDRTKITDAGLVYLKNLKNLRQLNLNNTQVTAQGIRSLRECSNLQKVFLFKTKVQNSDWAALKAAFPKTVLDTGGYIVKTLETDTTLLKANTYEK